MAGYVETIKGSRGRLPVTSFEITAEGKKARPPAETVIEVVCR